MLLRSFGAIHGLRGIDCALKACATAGVPVNGCTTGSRGSEGIGTAGVPAAAATAGTRSAVPRASGRAARSRTVDGMTRQRANRPQATAENQVSAVGPDV